MNPQINLARSRKACEPFVNCFFFLHSELPVPRYVELVKLRWIDRGVEAAFRYGFKRDDDSFSMVADFTATFCPESGLKVALVKNPSGEDFSDFPSYLENEFQLAMSVAKWDISDWESGIEQPSATTARLSVCRALVAYELPEILFIRQFDDSTQRKPHTVKFTAGDVRVEVSPGTRRGESYHCYYSKASSSGIFGEAETLTFQAL